MLAAALVLTGCGVDHQDEPVQISRSAPPPSTPLVTERPCPLTSSAAPAP